MPFVRRNTEGKIDAVYDHPEGGATEELPADDPEVAEFLGFDLQAKFQQDEWLQSDLALARVIEDVIDVLIEKGVISFTDLPEGAQMKLIKRQGLRSELSYVASLFGEGEEDDDGDGEGFL